jgi:Subtilase family
MHSTEQPFEEARVVKFSGLLVKMRGEESALARAFGAGAVDIEPILRVPAQPGEGPGVSASQPMTWYRVGHGGALEHPWDAVHDVLQPGSPFAAAGAGNVESVEPNLEQGWLQGAAGETAEVAPEKFCKFDEQDESGLQARGPGNAWNSREDFSEFKRAREQVGEKLKKVVIAHLDTGYDPNHITRPKNLTDPSLHRNFVRDGFPLTDATDHVPENKKFLRNRGHGTGTLSLLAGNKLDGASPAWGGFVDYVGGAPAAQILPIRIADWVVRFTTSTMVQGFEHARASGAHVLSMSMGGLSSQALVDAVNLAYDAGLVMVTAAGNNIEWTPSPKSIVFPARLRRVLAACGVMADGRAYADLSLGTMQGNYGPAAKMDTALGAYTPNVPWAQIGCANVVDMNGCGTSAATPQIAAAAALWLAEHWDKVSRYPEPWMRVEAVRQALFQSARKKTERMDEAETQEKIGQGVLRAHAALKIQPSDKDQLKRLPPAQASWSWLNLLFGRGGVSFAVGGLSTRERQALALELTQIAQRIRKVDEAIDDPDRPPEEIPAAARNRYFEAALDEGNPSKKLRAVLEQLVGRKAAGRRDWKPEPAIKRKIRQPSTPSRRLRAYALDPSIGKRIDSIAVNETLLSVPWEEKLEPGPVGEYLEVVDVDPASNKVYEPVDLNRPELLAQDGWAPSEGNPQFHQQMVYAVAMTTIGHFEKALGRLALWAPRRPDETESDGTRREVRKLRIYPHALRTDNAYYSPEKKALLFGYFQSNAGEGDASPAGSMVFTCLSSDIIAHETTHALLDGLHRRFEEASNPDVLAFHEGFADIVALFQHFTMPELVRFEIARARGSLRVDGLLAGLAKQFGEASGQRGPLRNYVNADPKVLHYPDVAEVHDRGSILVYAVYDAFRMIVERRTKDLLRLATGGSGVLRPGEIHPDLVDRLTVEMCKSAGHVLRMCIRALDYCPPVDITFGEYLRAIVTADLDFVANDQYRYRTAFMEAFRKWNILPRGMRTISEETLAWNTPDETDPKWKWLQDIVATREDDPTEKDRIIFKWNADLDRHQILRLQEDNRLRLWRRLKKAFEGDPSLYGELGLLPGVPRYDREGNVKEERPAPSGTFEVHSVRPARRATPDGTLAPNTVVAVITQRQAVRVEGSNRFFWFRGGATLIIDPREGHEKIRYSIIKNSGSKTRRDLQAKMIKETTLSSLRALYFGGREGGGRADAFGEPFAMTHGDRGDPDYA